MRGGRLASDDTMEIVSRRPEWNAAAGTLMMKFLGSRVAASSSKNFLLELLEDPAEGEGTGGSARTPCLQFGKVKGGRFSCDLRYPMSYMQAFGIFLSSFYWLPLLDEQEADGGGAEA